MIVTAAALVCLVAAYGAVTLTRGSESLYPAAWDPRIEPLARFVEEERGAPFLHPVYVDFIDSAAFDRSVVSNTEPTEEERVDADRAAGLYRALGLVSGELDLLEGSDQVATEGVAAFYSQETKRITIDGLELDPQTRSTVIHELVHAWQDQILGFDEIESRIDPAAYDAYRAAIEGDAMRVEVLYVENELTDAERAELGALGDEATEAPVEPNDDGPPSVLMAEFSAWYELGHPYVGILEELRGTTAIEDAIRNPTASSKVLIDPFARVEGHRPENVPEPPLVEGEERFDSGSLGALFLYLVLNERVGSQAALLAVDGWAGDTYVAFTRDGQTCMRAEVRAESPEALAAMSGAFSTWAAAMPAGSVQLTTTSVIGLDACDPGADAPIPAPVNPELDPLLVPSLRMDLAHQLLAERPADVESSSAGVTAFVSCYVDQLVLTTPIAVLAAESAESAEIDAYVANAAQACAHLA